MDPFKISTAMTTQGNATVRGFNVTDGKNQLTVLDISNGANNNDGGSIDDFVKNLFQGQNPQGGIDEILKKFADLSKTNGGNNGNTGTTTGNNNNNNKTSELAQKFKQAFGMALLMTIISDLMKGNNTGGSNNNNSPSLTT